MKYLSLFFVFTSCISLHSHSFAADKSQGKPPVLIPLAVGNTWKYRNRDKPGEIIISTVEKSQLANGITWFLYNEMGDKFWVRNDGMTQYELLASFSKNTIDMSNLQEALVLSTPGNKPYSYTLEGYSVTYTPCTEPITVLAGTFYCHIYKFDLGDGYYSITYYAENIGVLLNKYYSSSGYEVLELFDYQLK